MLGLLTSIIVGTTFAVNRRPSSLRKLQSDDSDAIVPESRRRMQSDDAIVQENRRRMAGEADECVMGFDEPAYCENDGSIYTGYYDLSWPGDYNTIYIDCDHYDYYAGCQTVGDENVLVSNHYNQELQIGIQGGSTFKIAGFEALSLYNLENTLTCRGYLNGVLQYTLTESITTSTIKDVVGNSQDIDVFKCRGDSCAKSWIILDNINLCPEPVCDLPQWCLNGIGDGKCHTVTNNAGCGFDGGDCCKETCDHPNCGLFWGYDCKDPSINQYAPACTHNYKLIGDGLCHDPTNNAECGYDGGDCCASTCVGPNCGAWGYACVDPSA